jgi:hypothetical protein
VLHRYYLVGYKHLTAFFQRCCHRKRPPRNSVARQRQILLPDPAARLSPRIVKGRPSGNPAPLGSLRSGPSGSRAREPGRSRRRGRAGPVRFRAGWCQKPDVSRTAVRPRQHQRQPNPAMSLPLEWCPAAQMSARPCRPYQEPAPGVRPGKSPALPRRDAGSWSWDRHPSRRMPQEPSDGRFPVKDSAGRLRRTRAAGNCRRRSTIRAPPGKRRDLPRHSGRARRRRPAGRPGGRRATPRRPSLRRPPNLA